MEPRKRKPQKTIGGDREPRTAPSKPAPTAPPGTRVVAGTLRSSDGTPIAGAKVHALARHLRGEQLLGNVTTDAHGHFEIRYSAATDPGLELVVRAVDSAGKPLATSPVIFNAPPEANVDLMVGGGTYSGPSEFEVTTTAIAPYLDNVAMSDLTSDDVSFLSSAAGVSARQVQALAWAYQQAKAYGVVPEALYAFAREGLPTDLAMFFKQTKDVRQHALEAALAANLIPMGFQARLGVVEKSVQAAHVEYLMNATGTDAGARVALGAAGLSKDERRRFLTLHMDWQGPFDGFWKMLASDPVLSNKAPAIQLAIQLTAIARGHAPLVGALEDMMCRRQWSAVSNLGQLTTADWDTLIAAAGFPDDVPGKDDAEKKRNYRDTLLLTVETLFPTATFAASLAGDDKNGNQDLNHFFAMNPGFDLLNDHVDLYLPKQAALDGIADLAQVVRDLKRLQRLFRLSPRHGDVALFLANGFSSATDVVGAGKNGFLARVGDHLGTERATKIFARAQRVAATAELLFARHAPHMNQVDLAVLPTHPARRG